MIDFPNSPTVGQIFTSGAVSWQWDGTKWIFLPGASGLPPGAMTAFAGASAPAGWLLCDGSAVSRTTYAALFTAIGTAYGAGDGSTTFNVPDMRGRVAAGRDAGNATGRLTASATGGVSAAALGNSGGEQAHVLGTPEIPSHTHAPTVTDPQHSHTARRGQFSQSDGSQQNPVGAGLFAGNLLDGTTLASSTGIGVTIANTGGGGGHNTVMPSLIVNWIVKT